MRVAQEEASTGVWGSAYIGKSCIITFRILHVQSASHHVAQRTQLLGLEGVLERL